MEEKPDSVLAWSDVYLVNQTMLQKIFPSDNSKFLEELRVLVEKERISMKPEDWLKCLTEIILSDPKLQKPGPSPGQLPSIAAEVMFDQACDSSQKSFDLFQTIILLQLGP